MNKASLIRVNEDRDGGFETVHHDLGEKLHRAVLEGDGPEHVGSPDTVLFRE